MATIKVAVSETGFVLDAEELTMDEFLTLYNGVVDRLDDVAEAWVDGEEDDGEEDDEDEDEEDDEDEDEEDDD